MKGLEIKDHWNGCFADILNYLKDEYKNVLFEKTRFEKSLILKVPEEYDFNQVFNKIIDKFNYDYDITIFDELYENKLILITTL